MTMLKNIIKIIQYLLKKFKFMKNISNKGLTPYQIKKAIYGENKKINLKTTSKPLGLYQKKIKINRKLEKHDSSSLFDVTYSTNQIYSQIPTPEWFDFTEKADISVICPLYMCSLEDFIKSWDFFYEGLKLELIFIDDNCPWKTGEKLTKLWFERKNENSKIGKIFIGSINQGYNACCNFGAEVATGETLVFLNPEGKLFPRSIFNLVKLLNQPKVGAVGGLHILEKEDTVVESGLEWSWEFDKFLPIGSQIYNNQKIQKPFQMNNSPSDIFQSGEKEAVSSNFMAIKKSLFKELGRFSPTINHQSWNDADFCCNIKEKKLNILYQQSARIYYKKIKTFDKFENKSKLMFFNKWVNSGRIDFIVNNIRKESISQINSILIKRKMAHGDVLVAAAIAPALKKKYPKAKIIFDTNYPEVVQGNPWIDQVVTKYSERQFNFFINLDMVYEYNPYKNFLQSYAEEAGVSVDDCKLFLETENVDFELPEKYIVMHAGNNFWAGRGWATIKFDQISKKLRKEGYKIVCVGTTSDHKPIYSDFDLRNKTSIKQMAHVIKNSSFFIGTDSFPMLVAETFKVKGISFFGSILPETRLITKTIKPISANDLPCIGCHHRKSIPCVSTVSCEIGVQECVNQITVDYMWTQIKNYL
jgi:ADP-heptose:LPS heptosyltransferase/GT2 family glycosyltransferase